MRGRESKATEVVLRYLEESEPGVSLTVSAAPAVVSALAEPLVWNRFGAEGVVLPPPCEVETVVMRLPRGRRSLAAMASVAAACLRKDGRMWIYGANDEGIKSSARHLSDTFDSVITVDTRRHCRILEATGPRDIQDGLDQWESRWEDEVGGKKLSFVSLAGVFAEGRIDPGTRLLLESLVVDPGARVLDYGCGAGVIGAFLGERPGELVGLDHDAWAVHCARQNSPGSYVVSHGWSAIEECFDHIVSNPPFHTGNDVDLGLIGGLVEGAHARLVRGGKLTFVCPATTPVRKSLEATYHTCRVVAENRAFRVWEATT